MTICAIRSIDENITDVVTCGGDGTISSVAAALMDLDMQFWNYTHGLRQWTCIGSKNSVPHP